MADVMAVFFDVIGYLLDFDFFIYLVASSVCFLIVVLFRRLLKGW